MKAGFCMKPRRDRARGMAWLIYACALLGTAGCDSRRELESRGAAPASLGFSRPPPARAELVPDSPDASVAAVRRARRSAPEPALAERPVEAVDATDVAGSVSGRFIIDGLVDVAAAGPIAATEHGIAMFNRDNRLQLARLAGALTAGAEPRETPLEPLPDEAGPFPLARGPAVRRGLAYWVSRGRLLGQSLASAGAGSPLILAEDARVGTRAAVPVGPARYLRDLPQLAAYVARAKDPDGPPTARLWIEGQLSHVPLTDDLSASHSVALAATPKGLYAVFLEARTGMSSIHVRQITFSKTHEPSVGEDHIVWVGGPARPTTELFILSSEGPRVRSFLTLERDITHFGLADLDVSLAPGAEFPVLPDWRLYDNGIEPAPFALGEVCGRSVVALARPSSAVPHAPQELVLLELDAERGSLPAVVARSRAFFDVSLVGVSGGAMLGYVADHRTWARAIRCVRP
jgi:hypothetical protein